MKKAALLFLFTSLSLSIMAQWSDNAALNLQITSATTEEVIPKVALCPNGDYYIGYFTSGGSTYNVKLQRLSNSGELLWQENGIMISVHPSMSWLTDWDMTADADNHAILTFQDIREGGNNNVVAYRISPEGEFVWGANGIMLSTGDNFDVAPKVTVTAANNAVFAWQSDNHTVIQKLNPLGQKLWGDWGIIISTANKITWPQLMPVGDDDVILKFFEDSGPGWAPVRHIQAQRFNASGQPVWPSNTIIYNVGSINAWYQILPIVNDGNDGFYIAWYDYSISGTIASAWIQHVNASGAIQFAANGVLLSDLHSYNQFYPQIAKPQGDPNVYVYWREVNGSQNQWGIVAQKISQDGQRLWGDNGKVIHPVGGNAVNPLFVFPVEEEMMLVYEDGSKNLIASRIKTNGDFSWNPQQVFFNTTSGTKVHMDASDYDGKQWVFAWEEDRMGSVNIFAQNLHHDGALGIVTPPVTYELILLAEPENMGTVQGAGLYEAGEMVSITATAYDNYVFLNWTNAEGEVVSEESAYEFSMPENDLTLTANFVSPPITYELVLLAAPEFMGTVQGAGLYEAGEMVSITAIAYEGAVFLNWVNTAWEVISEEATYEFPMPENDLILTATFGLPINIGVFTNENIQIFPNPAVSNVVITASENITALRVYDAWGRLLESYPAIDVVQFELNISTLPQGIYFFTLTTATQTITRRVVIKKQ